MSSSRGPDPRRGLDPRCGPDVTDVVVGFRKGTLSDLDELLAAGSVLVLDEPDIVEAWKAIEKAEALARVGGTVAAATQDEPHAERLVALVPRPACVRAAMPAVVGLANTFAMDEEMACP